MSLLHRREFLERSTAAGLGLAAASALLTAARPARAVAANDKIVLAVMGIRGRGAALAQGFAERPDCEVAYLCDPDSSLFESRAKPLAELSGRAPQTVQDFLRALDDPAVKERAKREVDAAIAAGVFGSPFFVVDGEPFWGCDRMSMVEEWIRTGGW